MSDTSRRAFVKAGMVGGFAAALSGLARAADATVHLPTPGEIEGPFYPITPQKDKDFDLTQIEGKSGVARGRKIIIEGRVLDTDGQPVEDATVDLWQANAAGRYRHPHDPNPAPLDPNFQGWAIVQSGRQGQFRFKTVLPGAYPASRTWLRTPHIHFKISKRGYLEMVTQMYFEGQNLNESDLLLLRKSETERQRMIAKRIKDEPETYRYTIVLQKV